MADAHSMECGEQLKRSNLNGIVQLKFRLRHTVHDWILLADAQWPASLFCTHDSAWWLQMSFSWPLTWDFPMADAHSMECGEQLKRSNLNGIVQLKFRLRHTVHDWILLADAQWPAFPVRSELGEKNKIKTRSKHFHFEKEEGRSPRSKQKEVYYMLQKHWPQVKTKSFTNIIRHWWCTLPEHAYSRKRTVPIWNLRR